MKANDICIGDWLNIYTFPNDNPKQDDLFPAKVSAVSAFDPFKDPDDVTVELVIPNTNGLASRPLNTCLPIKLTEEILVKNGFIFNKGYAVLQVSEDTYLDFYKHEHRLRKVWEGIDEWNNHAKIRDVSFVCQCYYVHEFQHALRLCGVEKSIIL